MKITPGGSRIEMSAIPSGVPTPSNTGSPNPSLERVDKHHFKTEKSLVPCSSRGQALCHSGRNGVGEWGLLRRNPEQTAVWTGFPPEWE